MSEPGLLRPITGFHLDEHADWVAELSCKHGQHVRHRPPFWSRPWTQTEDGRASMLGQTLRCVLCERFELPATVTSYKRTPDFTAQSMPAGLRAQHSTKVGVWGLIHVLTGELRYHVDEPLLRDEIVRPITPAVIVPEVLHHVAPSDDATFFVEFLR